MEKFDVAVVGLGALGSAATYQAALKGAKVIGFEQFEFGHVHGSSHDTSRIVRTSYDAPEYVALARSAYKDWAKLEEATGQKLLNITGGVVFVTKNGTTSVKDWTSSLDTNGVPYEQLGHKEVMKRWPQFNIGDNVDTVYTPDTGIVHASRSVAAMQYLARSHGAVLKEHTRVERVTRQSSGGVIIETSKGRFHAAKVILAADAWTNKLLSPLNAEIPLEVTQEQVTYYKPSNPEAWTQQNFPVWIWGGDIWFYGFPSFGEPTIKAGRDRAENFMAPENRSYVHSQELLQQLTSFMNDVMPDKDRQTLRTVTCQYTVTPDRQFIISPLEKHRDIIVGLGAAHAFKFAPAFGRVLAELAIDGQTTDDISKFGIPKVASRSSKL